MLTEHWLAWLYWNPPREAFTLPFIDHPVMWYGICFITGFILGYFIIVPIIALFVNQSKHLSSMDIQDWKLLVNQLKTSSSPLIQKCQNALNRQERQNLNSEIQPLNISSDLKNALLNKLNTVLKENSIQRKDLEQTFQGAITSAKQISYFLADRLCWFIVFGTLIGARLGAVFFYDWNYFKSHPLEIFEVWKGGLASHGGALGVMLALFFYTSYIKKWAPTLSFLRVLDFVAIPSALTAVFIRIGNFFNQEIIGTPSDYPWAVLFAQPADGSLPIPRHPVQLYEAFAYLMTFFLLFTLWKKCNTCLAAGTYAGFLFIFNFSSRFLLEFWKANLDSILTNPILQMGQLLSIPFILFGICLVWRKQNWQNLFCCHR
ncbi:prolipoprotein diacylglyceryl transferase [Candidatus Protochlamydia sp. W-9]|uniref:prolipoprotein diacylglyceryl transferase n=1 Tax=Candidatus Protochlamydia sp. W-9 TaxID=1785087 RepID=UPI00096A403E|nr:prolipoprotein diacylglyceryl transferase [Candidatus Protochlamydia sp. W-9]